MDELRADRRMRFADVRRRIAAGLTIVWLAFAGPYVWADSTTSADSTTRADWSRGSGGAPSGDSTTSAHALRIVSQYNGVWGFPPIIRDTNEALDAPLLGNGDVGVAILGRPDAMTFILSKNEFWSLSDGAVKSMARMNLAIGGLAGATYRMQQDISRGEVIGTFTLAGNTLQTTSWMQATDTTTNLFVTRFQYTGRSRQTATVSFSPGNGNEFPFSSGSTSDVLFFEASADNVPQVNGFDTRKVRLATRVIGAEGTISNNTLSFTLSPGRTYYVVTSVVSNYDTPNYQSAAIDNVCATTAEGAEELRASHESWWRRFYGNSFVEIGNKRLEKQWYGSVYLLASSARENEAAPGLWGNWIADTPAWNSDYTLNYNYEVPFLMALPTNHVDLAKPYDKAILDWVPNAQAEAAENGWTGAFYRIHIGPLPNGSSDLSTLNQKSLGAFAATNMIQRFYYTRDAAYANSVYGFLKEAALFWQNYLVFDGTRYVIINDAQQEGDPDPQTNGVLSLGLVRFLLQGCIDISSQLNVDAELRSTWQSILGQMSAFPTQTLNGQTVFRYTEVGRDWYDTNSIGIQHIYPASQVGLDSDATLLQIARNTVGQMARWSDQNGTNTFYPAAARVGYDPGTILTQLDGWVAGNTYSNMYIHTGGGGVEGFNTVPATLAEMFVQSFQGKIRVFANWPSDTDAKFGDLLAYNNLLVSSEIRANAIRYVRFVSRGGLDLTFHNPWPGQALVLYRNGVAAGSFSATDITLATRTNEVIHVAPKGTSYTSILRAMAEPGPGNSAVTASSETDNHPAPQARDGDLNTFWSSRVWTSVMDYQWLAVDLGFPTMVNRWVVRHYGGAEDARDFKLQSSSDGINWTDVDSVTGNTADVTDRQFSTLTARYFRVYITVPQQTTAQWARIREFELYNSNLVTGSTITASSEYTPDNRLAFYAGDGDLNTFWSSNFWASPTDYQWLAADLGVPTTVKRWVVRHYGGAEDPQDFKLQSSQDGINWTDVDSVTDNTADVTDRQISALTARYFRVYITVPQQYATDWARIREFELYN